MSTYAYSGYDTAGGACRGWIDASSAKRARLLLSEQGVLTESLRPVSEQASASLSEALRESLYRELAALLTAGLPLEQALGILMQGAESALALPCAVLREKIREGGRVADAMAAVCATQSAFEAAALVAAERSGNLAEAFLALSSVLGNRRELRERLRSALTYPLFVCALGLLLAGFMSFFMAPRALRMLSELQDAPPTRAAALVGFMRVALIAGLGGLALALPFWQAAHRRLRRNLARRIRVEVCLYRLPGLRGLLEALWSARFAAALAMLSRAGTQRVDALGLAGAASGSAWIARDAGRQVDAVRHGIPLSQAVAAIRPLRRALTEWTRIGESGGCLDDLLAEAAIRLQADYERRVARAMTLLEPLLILLIGAFVLIVALGVLLPLLTVARGMAL